MKEKTKAIIFTIFGIIIGIIMDIIIIMRLNNEQREAVIEVMEAGGPVVRGFILFGFLIIIVIFSQIFNVLYFIINKNKEKKKNA